MDCKAENIDTSKAMDYLAKAREYQKWQNRIEVARQEGYIEGLNKGLDIAEGIFECDYFGKEESTEMTDAYKNSQYISGYNEAILELLKMLGVDKEQKGFEEICKKYIDEKNIHSHIVPVSEIVDELRKIGELYS